MMGNIWSDVKNGIDRTLLYVTGGLFLFRSLYLVYIGNTSDGSAVFFIGFICIIYANVSRFKRFKGLGFEAETWEDKQKEAADLIERLRNVVSIYTHEIVLGKVKSGRWQKSMEWMSHWELYDNLVTQHQTLGQQIDFSVLKKEMDDYFLFDMTSIQMSEINSSIMQGIIDSENIIKKRIWQRHRGSCRIFRKEISFTKYSASFG